MLFLMFFSAARILEKLEPDLVENCISSGWERVEQLRVEKLVRRDIFQPLRIVFFPKQRRHDWVGFLLGFNRSILVSQDRPSSVVVVRGALKKDFNNKGTPGTLGVPLVPWYPQE